MGKDFVRRLDGQALERLLAECGDSVEGIIFRLAWKQGLTREEIRSLTWSDLLFSEHQLCLPDRTVPLGERLAPRGDLGPAAAADAAGVHLPAGTESHEPGGHPGGQPDGPAARLHYSPAGDP